MAENVNPDVDSGVDKQKVLKEIMSTQGKEADTQKQTAEKSNKEAQDAPSSPSKIESEKRSAGHLMPSEPQVVIPSSGLWAGIKEHRREIATLFTLLIGLVWLLIAYYTKEAIPLLIATVLLAPNIFYIFQLFKKKPAGDASAKEGEKRKPAEEAD